MLFQNSNIVISLIISYSKDAAGLCSKTAGASNTGVQLTNKADISLSLSIEANLGDEDSKPKWSDTLFDATQDLPSQCIPLSIPGLDGASGGKTATSKGSKSSSAASKSKATTGQKCEPPGLTGICQTTSTACPGGDYISGYCPGDSSIKCCPDAATKAAASKSKETTGQTCKPPGKTGTCQSTSKTCSGGSYVPGYCPGDASNQCCPDSSSSPSNSVDSTASSTCKPPGKTGVCQKTSKTCDGGDYISGYCPGDSSIKCCPDAPSTTSPDPPTSTTCKPPGKTGICQNTSKTCDGGHYISGYCPGDDTVKCCPKATPSPSPSAVGGGGCKREVAIAVAGVERRMLVAC